MLKNLPGTIYHGFYFVSPDEVVPYDSYSSALKKLEREIAFLEKERGEKKTFFVAALVTYGNLSPMVIGLNSIVSPFVQEYQILKDSLRSFLCEHRINSHQGTKMLQNIVMKPHSALNSKKLLKSSFSYGFFTYKGKELAVVKDNPSEHLLSVTNNISNISKALQEVFEHVAIIYQDTQGFWVLYENSDYHDICDENKVQTKGFDTALKLAFNA